MHMCLHHAAPAAMHMCLHHAAAAAMRMCCAAMLHLRRWARHGCPTTIYEARAAVEPLWVVTLLCLRPFTPSHVWHPVNRAHQPNPFQVDVWGPVEQRQLLLSLGIQARLQALAEV